MLSSQVLFLVGNRLRCGGSLQAAPVGVHAYRKQELLISSAACGNPRNSWQSDLPALCALHSLQPYDNSSSAPNTKPHRAASCEHHGTWCTSSNSSCNTCFLSATGFGCRAHRPSSL